MTNKGFAGLLGLAILAGILLAGCSGGDDEVASGTYEGKIVKVVPEEKEIYVETNDGRTLELYFTENTKLLSGDKPVMFTALADGASVKVEVKNEGGRVVPVKVEITD